MVPLIVQKSPTTTWDGALNLVTDRINYHINWWPPDSLHQQYHHQSMLWLISAALASPSTTWASPNKIINPQPFCSQRKKHPPCFLWPTTYPPQPHNLPPKKQQKITLSVVGTGTCSQAWLWTSPFCLFFFWIMETPTRIGGEKFPPKNVWNHAG